MKLLITNDDGLLNIKASGSLDQRGVIDFKEMSGKYFDFEEKKMKCLSDAALFLDKIDFISSSGIGLIVLLNNILSSYNKNLYILKSPQFFKKMTAVLMLDRYLKFCESIEEVRKK
ncbi:MAG TPA: hypothetical protein PKK26_15715 [Candidatus Wallbacteria bacterium]|nr:hypothetical protein [Candidatus Wallbacteria bacterium]